MMKLSMHAIEGFLAALVNFPRAMFFDLVSALTPPVRIHVSLLGGWHYPRDICRCSCNSTRPRERGHFEGEGNSRQCQSTDLSAGISGLLPGRPRLTTQSPPRVSRSSPRGYPTGRSEGIQSAIAPRNPPIASKCGINKMKLSMHAIEGFLAARVSLVRAVFFDLISGFKSRPTIQVPHSKRVYASR